MDLQMPDMGGLEATQAIRTDLHSKNQSTPVVALTAHAFEEDKKRCLAAGMDDYLSKPLDRKALANVIQRFLASKKG